MIIELRAKSQVTLPKPMLESIGLSVGDMLEITERNGGIFMQPVVVTAKKRPWQHTKQVYEKVLDELCGSIDDPTMVEPNEIEYESPREQIS